MSENIFSEYFSHLINENFSQKRILLKLYKKWFNTFLSIKMKCEIILKKLCQKLIYTVFSIEIKFVNIMKNVLEINLYCFIHENEMSEHYKIVLEIKCVYYKNCVRNGSTVYIHKNKMCEHYKNFIRNVLTLFYSLKRNVKLLKKTVLEINLYCFIHENETSEHY